MSKGLKIFFWILMALVIILIIYIAVTAKKGAKGAPAPGGAVPAPGPTDSPVAGTGNTDADKEGINTNVPPVNVGTGVFSVGQRLYAGSDVLNVYESCTISQSNIANTYYKGGFIGTFLRKEGYCIVVNVPTGYNIWVPFIGNQFIELSSENYYIVSSANVYTK